MKRLRAVFAVMCLIALAGCSVSTDDSAPPEKQVVQVYAAASLTAAFDEIAQDFETQNSDIDVLPVVYGGSSTLATQIVEGAPVDVFASADEFNMQTVADEQLTDESPRIFATNTLVVALAPGNPANVRELLDLEGASVVLCAAEVPCGRASQTLLANQVVAVTPVSVEQSVTAVLQKVALGEADAGLVYATDVINAGVESFVPDGAEKVVNSYPISALTNARHPAAAKKFVEYVLGDAAAKVLSKHGFGEPR